MRLEGKKMSLEVVTLVIVILLFVMSCVSMSYLIYIAVKYKDVLSQIVNQAQSLLIA